MKILLRWDSMQGSHFENQAYILVNIDFTSELQIEGNSTVATVNQRGESPIWCSRSGFGRPEIKAMKIIG